MRDSTARGNRQPFAVFRRRMLARIARVPGLLAMLAMLTWNTHAAAGVTPEISRVVFGAGAVEQSLQLFNVNQYPVLVQAWVDDGRIDALPQESKAPVIALPPVFRMEAGSQTSLRLIDAGAALPTDRESLFWLNLYEIPATPKQPPTDEVSMTVTMRTQIKVFMRPNALPYPSSALTRHLAFSLRRSGSALALAIDNPTPYHATIGLVQITVGERSAQLQVDMLAPFSSTTVSFDKLGDASGDNATLRYSLIGDDGNPVMDERRVPIASADPGGDANRARPTTSAAPQVTAAPPAPLQPPAPSPDAPLP
jgi:P pilus assembly chaperone PapD